VCDDEAVDDVEVGGVATVHSHDGAALDDELGLGIVRAVGCDQAQLGVRRHELLDVELAGGA
jgi:hypothetical protein